MDRRTQLREKERKRVIRNRLIASAVLVALIIAVIVILISCNKKNKKAETETTSLTETTTEETTTKAEIKNDKPVHAYGDDYENNRFYRMQLISKPWTDTEDLETIWAVHSHLETLDYESEIQLLRDLWYGNETPVPYKIGYELSFDVGGEHKIITILKPGDIENNPDLYSGDYPEDGDYSGIGGFMGAWLYNDIQQEEGAFYSHVTQEEFTDDTLLTSIKLRPTPRSVEISNLVLKVFSYSSDEEFDENGHYAGNYPSVVEIRNENN